MTHDIIGRGWAFPPQIGRRGGLALVTEETELVQAIEIILRTAPGTRVMRPTFGCRLHELVFAPNNSHTAVLAQGFVEEALGMWEPRIVVLQVDAYPQRTGEGNCLLIEIQYKIKATHDKRSLVHPFYLIPEE